MRFATRGVAKVGEHAFHCEPRRDLAQIAPAHAIGGHEQPAMRLRLRRAVWLHVALEVFVVAPFSPRVGYLRELQVEQCLSPQTAQIFVNGFAQQGR